MLRKNIRSFARLLQYYSTLVYVEVWMKGSETGPSFDSKVNILLLLLNEIVDVTESLSVPESVSFPPLIDQDVFPAS